MQIHVENSIWKNISINPISDNISQATKYANFIVLSLNVQTKMLTILMCISLILFQSYT